MKKGSAHIVTLVQLLILCAMFSTAFMASRGFFNDLLTAKQYGLEICALFGAVLLTLTLIAAALVLPPAQSRAAWIAGTVGCLFVMTCHPVFKSTWKNLKKRIRSFIRPIQALSMLATLLFVLVIGFGLYTMKKGSADGRVLIWQVTSQLIKQKPITGHGSGAFAALYMNEQANWFEAGKGTETQSMVAGSPEAPFNEVLKLWLEKGLLAVVLAGALLYFLLRDKSLPAASSWQTDQDQEQSFDGPVPNIGVKGSLLALLVFSYFSYPFAISSFVLQLVFLAALLAGASKTILTIKGRKTILLTLPFAMTILVVSIHYYPHRKEHYQAMSVWRAAERWYNFRAYQAAVESSATREIMREHLLFPNVPARQDDIERK
jgi:O-antigen polymerase